MSLETQLDKMKGFPVGILYYVTAHSIEYETVEEYQADLFENLMILRDYEPMLLPEELKTVLASSPSNETFTSVAKEISKREGEHRFKKDREMVEKNIRDIKRVCIERGKHEEIVKSVETQEDFIQWI